MMRGDGFQCDIPDPVTENLLRAMLKQEEQASGRSSKTRSSYNSAQYDGPTTTKLDRCDLPNRYRYGDQGTPKNPHGEGCPNEPLCCRSKTAANPEDGCNCSGMPLPNSRRQGVYDVRTDRLNFGKRFSVVLIHLRWVTYFWVTLASRFEMKYESYRMINFRKINFVSMITSKMNQSSFFEQLESGSKLS